MDKWSKLRRLVPLFWSHKSMTVRALQVGMETEVTEMKLEGKMLSRILTGAGEDKKIKMEPAKFEGKLYFRKGGNEIRTTNKTLTEAQAEELAKRVVKRFGESHASIKDGLRGLDPNTRVDLTDTRDVFLIGMMKILEGMGELEFKVNPKAEDRDIDEMRDYMILNELPDVDILQKDAVFKLKNGNFIRIK